MVGPTVATGLGASSSNGDFHNDEPSVVVL